MRDRVMNANIAPNAEDGGASGSRRVPIFINRNFALLWSGGAISILGDFVFNTTLVLWIATSIARGQPWAPLAVSGVLLSTTIPIVVVGPLAGVFADRASILGLSIGPIDTIFTFCGLLAIIGGIYLTRLILSRPLLPFVLLSRDAEKSDATAQHHPLSAFFLPIASDLDVLYF